MKYFDLKQHPSTDYIFSYDRMLDTKGNMSEDNNDELIMVDYDGYDSYYDGDVDDNNDELIMVILV